MNKIRKICMSAGLPLFVFSEIVLVEKPELSWWQFALSVVLVILFVMVIGDDTNRKGEVGHE